MSEPIYVQLMWEDPMTGELKQPILAAPIALGRKIDQMPEQLGEQFVSRLELEHKRISRFHALITVANQQMYVTDKSSNGTFLNGRLIGKGSQPFSSKDTLRIGHYKITATLIGEKDENATELNREPINFSLSANRIQKNTLPIWLIGVLVLFLMSLGAWLLVSTLLKYSRPQVPAKPIPSSSTIIVDECHT
ncbi:MAG: FHA domain-containing protein [Xenococcaceae cyanobacterium]